MQQTSKKDFWKEIENRWCNGYHEKIILHNTEVIALVLRLMDYNQSTRRSGENHQNKQTA